MGFVLKKDGFDSVLAALAEQYRIYAPTRKVGMGRFTDTDVILYDFVTRADEIVLDKKSDYAFKEFLTPLSETLFYFTEEERKTPEIDLKPVLIFLRSCDMHAVKRLDQTFIENGKKIDWYYQRRRDLVKYVLIGCRESFENCFCASMGSNKTEDGYLFSIESDGELFRSNVLDPDMAKLFSSYAELEEEVIPSFVKENETKVTIPEVIPPEISKHPLWDEYNTRCIGCGRCNFVCPTCTCFTMQDLAYSENGKVGERRRVSASCMVNGYTDVAGGGSYRKKQGERMRFKVMHKIWTFRKRYGYDMCVGCGRCDDVCPEYISYSNIINKVNEASASGGQDE